MKKVLLLLAVAVTTLTSCLDTVEEFTIAADGSGTYHSTMDISGMMEMMETMAAMDNSGNNDFKKISEKDIDSTMKLAPFVDTASDLTAEQKRLFRDAEMTMKINQKEKVFKMGMLYPFKSLEDVNKIIALSAEGKGVGLHSKSNKANNPMAAMGDEGKMPGSSEYFIVTIKDGLVERKVDEKKLAEFKSNPEMQQMPEMDGMLEAVSYKTVFKLPRPVKNVIGEKVVLSEDKRTVTVKSTLADLMKNPGSLAFKIEY